MSNAYIVYMRGRFTAEVIVEAEDEEAALEAASEAFDPTTNPTLEFDDYEHGIEDAVELNADTAPHTKRQAERAGWKGVL